MDTALVDGVARDTAAAGGAPATAPPPHVGQARTGAIGVSDGVDLSPLPEPPYAAHRVLLGCVGRIWLWFLVGCVAITVLPLIIGWSSYLIETGSMRPSIKPGDVVITSPDPTLDQLGGRVITFDSPSVPGRVVTHRVVEISNDGQMRTKGTPTPPSILRRSRSTTFEGWGVCWSSTWACPRSGCKPVRSSRSQDSC